ncbi:hypothetical protein HNR75_002027 [Tolumonas osonensis]|uniref:Uncharacterized protein n=1 Tax=Tolumonas osonensis TaxID=675874 RepID=A0A841GEU8_9GAMM|nr:hypothetical protein [Tolumonas osonensis]
MKTFESVMEGEILSENVFLPVQINKRAVKAALVA